MKVEFEGRTWQIEPNDLSVRQAIAITGFTGTDLATWEERLIGKDAAGRLLTDAAWLKAVQALHWLMLAQNDADAGAIGETDFAVLRFFEAYIESAAAEAGEAGGQGAADPTKPAGRPGGAAARKPRQQHPAG